MGRKTIRKLFNEEQKLKYIDTKIISMANEEIAKKDLMNLFYRLASIERELNKDVCDFSHQEITDNMYKLFCTSTGYQMTIISSLRSYVSWCIENGYSHDKENRFVGMLPSDFDIAKSYKMCMVKDENQLTEYCDIMFRDINEDTNDNMYRLITYLLFYGVPFIKQFDIKVDDYDYDTRTLTFGDYQIKVSETCHDIIDYVINQDEIVVNSRKGKEVKGLYSKAIDKRGYLIEFSSDNRQNTKATSKVQLSYRYSDLQNILKYDVSITPTSIMKSGEFCRAYEIEKTDGERAVEFSANKHTMQEYRTWKRAFDLATVE